MKRLFLLAALLGACSSTTTPVATGEFTGPSGLAATSAGDRDLLFIANEGRDNLRALQLCTTPEDAGVSDPCTPQDQQFLPAPIRVFPATIETGGRPHRLAGVRLSRPDGSKTGVVLAVGADDAVRTVDARNLIEAENHTAAVKPVLVTSLGAPPVDVVAENPLDPATFVETNTPAGQAATAFAATIAPGGGQARLLMLSVAVDAAGAATAPVVTGQCTLDPVVPTRLAIVPGGGDRVYVADGAGDGVVVIRKADIPAPSATPAPCVMDRISAGGRQVRSISVSPPWVEIGGPHPAGELLILGLEPSAAVTPGVELDPGGILIVRTADKAIAPVPPYSLFNTDTTLQAMQPISPPGIVRDVSFVRAIPPGGSCAAPPCTPVYIGTGTSPVANFNLLAIASSTDGGTYFIDVLNRRFVNTSYYLGPQIPLPGTAPLLSPSSSDPNPPQLNLLDPDATHPNAGWMTAGVTRATRYRVIWHGAFPGLETRGGFLTRSGTGNLLLNLPAVNLNAYAADPVLQFGPGDTVSFSFFSPPGGAPQACVDMANTENESPTRFELTVVSQPAADTLELAPLTPTASTRAFDISPCPAGIGVVAAVRAGRDVPWLIFDGETVRGRTKTGADTVVTGQRFDYPLDSTVAAPPLSSDNTAIAFALSGDEPIQIGSEFTFAVTPGVTPQSFRDTTLLVPQGLATATIGYSSPRRPLLVFTSVSGENSVLQADPSVLTSVVNGVLAYK